MTKAKTSRLVETEVIIKVAQEVGWSCTRDGDTLTFECPQDRRNQLMKPQTIRVVDEDGRLKHSRTAHSITTTAIRGGELKSYRTRGWGALRVIKNTYHPFQVDDFMRKAQWDNDEKLCEPVGVSVFHLGQARVRGYMTEKVADELSIRVLRMTPAEVWGAEEYLRAFYEKWD